MVELSMKQAHWIWLATNLARMSSCNKRHGAMVVRNGNVLSVGINKYRNDPHQPTDHPKCISIHAEEQALKACKGDTEGATIYVARVAKDGLPAYSRPCGRCQKAIRKAGIRHVYYTGDNQNANYMEV